MSSQSLEDMWKEARERFRDLTGKDLQLTRSTSPDDLRKAFEARVEEQKGKTSPELARVKDAGLNILSCIQLFGGVAAQGAAMVFGPADICFNAISLLLDVPKKVRAFHDAIDAVFDEVAPTLSQFKIYCKIDLVDNVDDDLKLAIHKVLISFVDICAKCINFEHSGRWDRVKSHTKRLLCDDQSVEDELKKFKTLVQGQQNVQSAVILDGVLSGNRGVKALVEAEGSRKSDAVRREQFEKLKVRLGITEDATNNPKAVYEDMLKRSVPETGQWLGSNDAYTNWADRRCASTGATLHLKGAPNTGKSFAVSAIISRLKSEHSSPGSPDRSLVAYYFFSSVLTNKNDNETGPTAESALKWICLQLAEQDVAYAKVAYEACRDKQESWFKEARCEELWTALRIGEPLRNSTHYLILDGLDSLSKSAARQLLDIFRELPDATMGATQPCPVRVLVCGKPETLDSDLIKRKDCPVIQMEENMAADMRKYVQHGLKALFLDGKSQEQSLSIEMRLLEQPAFTFSSMQNTLDRIREGLESTGTVEQIDKIITENLRDPTVILREDVDRMEAQLSARQINLLNELFVWVIYGIEYLEVDQLEAALYLRFNETLFQGLGDFLRKKLSKIFKIDTQGRVLVMDGIEDIVVKTRDKPRNTAEEPQISLEIKITNAHLATVQRFLWDLSRHATLDSFDFRADGTATSETPKSSIMVNKVDAHLSIVKSAIALLRAPPSEKTEAIGEYLIRRMPTHLEVVRSATGFDEVGYDDKKTIGKFVFDLFDDPDIIQRHRSVCGECYWYGGEVKVFLDWLQDDAVIGSLGLSKSDKAWLDDINRARNPSRRLMSRMMRMVAKTWLRKRTGEPNHAASWIRAFLALEPRTATDEAGNESSSQASADEEAESAKIAITPGDPADTQIEAAERWSRAVLKLTDEELDSLWFERLGSTYASLDEHERAIQAFNEAKRRPSPSWNVFEGLATSLSAQGDERGACAALKLALEGQDTEAAVDVDPARKAAAYSRLAEWQHELRERDEAIRSSKKAYELCPEDLHQYNLLKYYVLSGRNDEARTFLVEAAGDPGLHSPSRPGLIVRHIAKAGSFTRYPSLYLVRRIVALVSEPECIDILLKTIAAAIKIAREEENYYECSALLICRGIAQLYDGKDDEGGDPAPGVGGGGSGGQLLHKALSSWRESYSVAAQNSLHQQSLGNVDDMREITTRLASWYLFDKLRCMVGGSSSDALGELRSLALQDKQPGRIWAAQCYLAAYYAYCAAQDQDQKSKEASASMSRDIFAPDMTVVLEMLSDGDQDNNENAFDMMFSIFLHTGDDVNALAALLFLPMDIPRRNLKDVLTELLKYPRGTQTDIEKEVARDILGLLETEEIVNYDDDGRETYDAVVRLISKAEGLQWHATKPEGPQQQQGNDEDGQQGNDEDGQQEPEEKPEEIADGVPDELEKEPRQVAHERAINILKRLKVVLGNAWSFVCDDCQTKWNFDNSMRTCRFCHNKGLCQTCFEALQTTRSPGGGHRGNKNTLLCGPDHEWLVLPSWDAKRWAESFNKRVRRVDVGSVEQPRGGETVVVDGESTEGDYDTMSASSWLKEIAAKWGFNQDAWDL